MTTITITSMNEYEVELRAHVESIVSVVTAEKESNTLVKRLARSGVDALAPHASAFALCATLRHPDTTAAERAAMWAEMESADAKGTLLARLLSIAETTNPEVANVREAIRRHLIATDSEFAHLREARH